MKELKVSRSTWLSHVLGILYPGPEFVELVKIIILGVNTWIYGYTNTHMPANLHSQIILHKFNFWRFLCLGFLFSVHFLSVCTIHLSLAGGIAGKYQLLGKSPSSNRNWRKKSQISRFTTSSEHWGSWIEIKSWAWVWCWNVKSVTISSPLLQHQMFAVPGSVSEAPLQLLV